MCRSFCSLTMRAAAVLAIPALVGAPALSAQTGTITGRVVDAVSGAPIDAAWVHIAELSLGADSDWSCPGSVDG